MSIDFSDIAEKLPDMTDAEKRDLLLKLRRFKNTQGDFGKSIRSAPKNDDEFHQWIKDVVGDDIPRVAVCEGHCAPFDFMADYFFERESALLVMANREGGKCVAHDSLIYDPVTGRRNKIKDIINDDRYNTIATMDKDGNIFNTNIDSKWNMGNKDCLKITLLSGRQITVTPEHPFMIQDGWFRADEIEVGDTIATPSFLPFHKEKKEIPDSHLTLIAGLLAEGSINEVDVYHTKRAISFSSEDEYFINLMTECSKEIGCEVHYTSGYDYNIVKPKGVLCNPVKEMLLFYNVSCKLAKEKIVPDIIFELGEEQVREFLSIFWMGDGFVEDSGIGIGLASKEMIKDLQHLLLKLGIQSHYRYKQSSWNGKYYDSWQLEIYSKFFEKFLEKIDLWGYKKKNLEALCIKDRSPREGRPAITDIMMEKFRKITPIRPRDTATIRSREASEMLGWKQFGNGGFGVSNLTKGRVKTLQSRRLRALCYAHELDQKQFSILLNNDLWWDTVVNISRVENVEIFDLTVNETSSFVANDIIVHNTKGTSTVNFAIGEFKAGTEICAFADIEMQTNKSYGYIKDLAYEDNNGVKTLKPTMDGDPLRKETKWKSGSKLILLIATLSGVNAQHSQKVHADEVDLMEKPIFYESRSISSTKQLKNGEIIKAQDINTSTRKSSNGIVQEILDECEDAIKKGFDPPYKIYIFCIFEVAREVPSCRKAPKDEREARLKELGKDPCELCNCNKIVKGELAEGIPRTLESVCKGRLFRSRGWMRYEDVGRKFVQNTPNVWVAQHECRRPMADGLYLPTWDRDRHSVRGYRPKPEYGLIWMGVDWGGTAASFVVWVQGPLHQELEIANNAGTSTILPKGSYVAFKELSEAAMGATRLAGKVVRQEIQFRNQFPGFRIKARFADMAGKQQRMDWREHNPPLRTVWYVSREVDPQIECIQALVTDNLLYVDSVGCPNLCDDFESWRQEKGREVHDDSSHGPAAMRYLLMNATTLEKRNKSNLSSTTSTPVVVNTRDDEHQKYGALESVGSEASIESDNWRKRFQNFGPGVSDDQPWQPS